MKRVFIIHGWDGYPEEGIFPWLKKELERKGIEAHTPAMPDPLEPKIETWIPFLKKQVGEPTEETFFVGHSMGAQTILRYVESLEKDQKIGGAVLLAGFVHLGGEAYESEDDPLIAKPWLETPLDWKKIKSHANKFSAVFSDNDPFVPLSDSEIFKKELGAEISVVHGWEHFSGSEGIKELPIVLEQLERMMDRNKEKLYRCKECGLVYTEKKWADTCQAWCREHKSCNLDIAKHARIPT